MNRFFVVLPCGMNEKKKKDPAVQEFNFSHERTQLNDKKKYIGSEELPPEFSLMMETNYIFLISLLFGDILLQQNWLRNWQIIIEVEKLKAGILRSKPHILLTVHLTSNKWKPKEAGKLFWKKF